MNNTRVKYNVLPAVGIVTAEIEGCSFDAINMFNDRFMSNSTSSMKLQATKFDERFLMPFKFKAVARLHPDDKWDERIGKRVALDHLTEKYHWSLNKHLFNIAEYTFGPLSDLMGYLGERIQFDEDDDE